MLAALLFLWNTTPMYCCPNGVQREKDREREIIAQSRETSLTFVLISGPWHEEKVALDRKQKIFANDLHDGFI
jgi:hypothetical protein